MNCPSSVVIATVPNFRYVRTGERVATVKSAPFAVSQAQLEALLSMLNDGGPILQARPIREPNVAVLYTDPVAGDRARTLFESVVRNRLERFGTSVRYALSCLEEEEQVTRSLTHLLRTRPGSLLLPQRLLPGRRTWSAALCFVSMLTWSGSSLLLNLATS